MPPMASDEHAEPELRLADGPSVEASAIIAAPPAVVWEIVSDIDVPARFSTELQATQWLDGDDGPRVGARFVGRNRHPAAGEWETTCTIVTCVPGRELGWVVDDPELPGAQWRFTLEPVAGGTRLTQWMRIGPGRSGINDPIERMPDKESKILHRRLAEHRENMERNLAGIAELATG